jgi:hypothetical protein
MTIKLYNFHCILTLDDIIIGCGVYQITDEREVHYENPTIYLALIDEENIHYVNK